MSKTGEETNMNYSKGFHETSVKMNEREREYISLVSIQQHLSMKVLFLFAILMVLAFAKLQYYIPGKAYSKCHQVTQVEFPVAHTQVFVTRSDSFFFFKLVLDI